MDVQKAILVLMNMSVWECDKKPREHVCPEGFNVTLKLQSKLEWAGTGRISQPLFPTARACSWVPGHGFHTKAHSYLSRALHSHHLPCAPHKACLPHVPEDVF